MTPQASWVRGGPPIATPYVKVLGLLSAVCRHDAHGTYLAIAIHAEPTQPRVGDIKGDIHFDGVGPGLFGPHLDDDGTEELLLCKRRPTILHTLPHLPQHTRILRHRVLELDHRADRIAFLLQ